MKKIILIGGIALGILWPTPAYTASAYCESSFYGDIEYTNREMIGEGWGETEAKDFKNKLASNNGELVVEEGEGWSIKIVSCNHTEWRIVAEGELPEEVNFVLYYQYKDQGDTEIFKADVTVTGEGIAPIVLGVAGTGSNSINEVRLPNKPIPPTPTCEELGTCAEPTCEELGNCPEPPACEYEICAPTTGYARR